MTKMDKLRALICKRDPVAVKRWLIENPHIDIGVEYLNETIGTENIDIVNCLLEDPRVDPSGMDDEYGYPIDEAVSMGDIGVIKRLLEDPRVDPSVNDNDIIRDFRLVIAEQHYYSDEDEEVVWKNRQTILALLESDPRVQSKSKSNPNQTNKNGNY